MEVGPSKTEMRARFARPGLFICLTFGVSWLLAGSFRAFGGELRSTAGFATAIAYMFVPAAACVADRADSAELRTTPAAQSTLSSTTERATSRVARPSSRARGPPAPSSGEGRDPSHPRPPSPDLLAPLPDTVAPLPQPSDLTTDTLDLAGAPSLPSPNPRTARGHPRPASARQPPKPIL